MEGYPRVHYSVHVRPAFVTVLQVIVLAPPGFLLKLHIRQSVDYTSFSIEAMHMRMKSSNQSQLKSSSPPSLAFPLSFRPSPVLEIDACPFSILLSSIDSLFPTNKLPFPTSPFEAPGSNSSLFNSASKSASVVGCAICVAFERDVRGNA